MSGTLPRTLLHDHHIFAATVYPRLSTLLPKERWSDFFWSEANPLSKSNWLSHPLSSGCNGCNSRKNIHGSIGM